MKSLPFEPGQIGVAEAPPLGTALDGPNFVVEGGMLDPALATGPILPLIEVKELETKEL